MSLYESEDSTGVVSLRDMFESKHVSALMPPNEPDIFELVCRGGWPFFISAEIISSEIHSQATTQAADQTTVQVNLQTNSRAFDVQPLLRDYLTDICKTDIRYVDKVQRDPTGVARLMESLSRNSGTSVSLRTLASDMRTVRPTDLSTAAAYLTALERLFIVEPFTPWPADLRSKAHIVSSPKRYLVDPSLAVAALRSNRRRLATDLKGFGMMFETLVIP